MDNPGETVDRWHGSELRRQYAALQAENKRLRKRVRVLTASRDHWKHEAQVWKWGALR